MVPMSERIYARLSRPLAEFVARMVKWLALKCVIHDLVSQGHVVLTVQHQVGDIKTLIAKLSASFNAEVERLKRKT